MATLRILLAGALLVWPACALADPLDRWSAPVAEASLRFGIPKDWILRVMRVESGGRLFLAGRPVVSRAGAMGLMQLMPGTWRDMQGLLGLGFDPYEPRDNILAGAAYLRALYDRFGYPGLFAAYNAGPARYAAALRADHPLPAETRAYVAAVAPGKPGRLIQTAVAARLFALSPTTRPLAPGQIPATQLPPAGLFVALSGTAAR